MHSSTTQYLTEDSLSNPKESKNQTEISEYERAQTQEKAELRALYWDLRSYLCGEPKRSFRYLKDKLIAFRLRGRVRR